MAGVTLAPDPHPHPTPQNMKSQVIRCSTLVATLLSSLVAIRAQESSAAGTRAGDEVVVLSPFVVNSTQDDGYRASNSVSGSRLNTPIKDLPFAITAFTSEFILDQNANSIFDIAKYAPGVTMRSDGFAEGNSRLSVRGFDTNSNPLRNGFTGPPVIDPTNVERVEVVKGPASFLYGQLSPGGLVNVITKRPQTFRDNSLRVSVGTDDYYRTALDVTGPVPGVGGLFYRLGGNLSQDSHYYEYYDADRWSFSPSLLYQVNKTGELMVSFERLNKNEGPVLNFKPSTFSADGVTGDVYPGLPKNWNSAALSDYRVSKSSNFVAEYTQGLGDHWNFRAAYATSTSNIEHFTHGIFIVGGGATASADVPPTATLPLIRRENAMARRPRLLNRWGDTEAFNLEAVAKYQLGRVSARLLLGWQMDTQNSDNKTDQSPVAEYPRPWDLSNPVTWDRNEVKPAVIPPRSHFHDDVEMRAYFAGLTLGFFNDRLLSLSGLRHTVSKTTSSNVRTGATFDPYETSANTPQVGLLYKLTDEISAYGSYSESFVPNNDDLLDADGNIIGPAKPVVGKGYDLGLKVALLNGKLSGTVSVYQINNTGIIQTIAAFDSDGNTSGRSVQTGEQQSQGVEFDVVISPVPHWQTYLSYSHQNPIYYKNPEDTSLEGILLQSATTDNASVWTKYKFTQGPMKGAYIAGGATWQGFQKQTNANHDLFFRPYALFDVTLGYTARLFARKVNLSLAVKNLANREYFPSVSSRGQPRTVILTMSTKL